MAALPVQVPIRVSRLVLPVLGALRYIVRYAWLTRMRQYGKSGGGLPTRTAPEQREARAREGPFKNKQQPGSRVRL